MQPKQSRQPSQLLEHSIPRAIKPSPSMSASRIDLPRITLGVISIVALIFVSLWVLKPFIGAAIWAATIVIATWPLLIALQSRLGGRRAPAVVLMTLGMVALFVVPITLAVVTVVQHVDAISAFMSQAAQMRPPPPPEWVARLPLVGAKLAATWSSAAAGDTDTLVSRLLPYAGPALQWLVSEIGTVGLLLAQSATVVVLAAVMYAHGEVAAAGMKAAVRRLAGTQGVSALVLAAQAVRGVALGVGITAVAQAALGGLGLWLAEVPYAALLTVLMLVLSIAQLGPLPVLLPAAAWMFYTDATGAGLLLLAVSAPASLLDNVLQPMLIRLGADLPLLLVFGGVVGGMLAFGLVGIFIGPVVLAVGYTLLKAWVAGEVDGDPAGVVAAGAVPEHKPPPAARQPRRGDQR